MTIYGRNGKPLVFTGYNSSTLVTKSSAGVTTKFNMNMTIGAGCEEFFINSSSSDDDDDDEDITPYSSINNFKSKNLHSVSFYEPSTTSVKKRSSKFETFKSKLSLSKASFASLKDLFIKTPKSKDILKKNKKSSILGKRSCDKSYCNIQSNNNYTPKSVLAKRSRIKIIPSDLDDSFKYHQGEKVINII